ARGEGAFGLRGHDRVEAVRREARAGAGVIGEPVARNTAAAIGAAALLVGDPATLAVLPADHLIEDRPAFRADVERAFEVAEREDVLITFGIRPTRPDTGLGYIRRGRRIGERLYQGAEFDEK